MYLAAIAGMFLLLFAMDASDGAFSNTDDDGNYVEGWEPSEDVKALAWHLGIGGVSFLAVSGALAIALLHSRRLQSIEYMARPKPEPELFPARPGEPERRLCKWCGEPALPEHRHCGKCGKRL
jgi:hypothetical protein